MKNTKKLANPSKNWTSDTNKVTKNIKRMQKSLNIKLVLTDLVSFQPLECLLASIHVHMTRCRHLGPGVTISHFTLQRKRRESASSSSSVKKVKKP